MQKPKVENPVTHLSSISLDEWKETYLKLDDLRNQWQRVINDQARKLSADAGLDPNLLGVHPHNAMVAYNAGNPWPNVDYDRVKMVQKLLEIQFDTSRCIEKWDCVTRPMK